MHCWIGCRLAASAGSVDRSSRSAGDAARVGWVHFFPCLLNLPAAAAPVRLPALRANANRRHPVGAVCSDAGAGAVQASRFLTVEEMAALLGVSVRTVRRRLQDGSLRRAPLGGRAVRIPATELGRLEGILPQEIGARDHSVE